MHRALGLIPGTKKKKLKEERERDDKLLKGRMKTLVFYLLSLFL
jgi:hypothetical protein